VDSQLTVPPAPLTVQVVGGSGPPLPCLPNWTKTETLWPAGRGATPLIVAP
jgi:hypothetical protein